MRSQTFLLIATTVKIDILKVTVELIGIREVVCSKICTGEQRNSLGPYVILASPARKCRNFTSN
jgi:hypothetical protein